jgi:hypothetical protein
MIKFLFRALGFLLLCGAFVFFIYDATRSMAASSLMSTKTAEAWRFFDPGSAQRVQLLIQGGAEQRSWEPVAETVLDAPAFVVVGLVGAILILLGTRNRRPTVIGPPHKNF